MFNDKRFELRLSEDLLNLVKKASSEADTSVAEYIREAIRDRLVSNIPAPF